jgi:hypothetical protein
MAISWISLPAAWTLQDVQAVLNVAVSVLSALGIFVVSRWCWRVAVAKIVKTNHVSLQSLLSISTIGEAVEILLLLKSKIISIPYLKILVQCVVVVCLTATAMLSGPIARYSTRRGHGLFIQDVPGLLATRLDSLAYANVEWNQTEASLIRAAFPLDQLLDFLPDNSKNWVYQPEQWNSTWSFNCSSLDTTTAHLIVTDNCSSLYSEVAGIDAVVSDKDYEYQYYHWDGFYSNQTLQKDVLMFLMGVNYNKGPHKPFNQYAMQFSLAAVHLHSVQRQQNKSSPCNFAPGAIGHARYNRIDCDLNRPEDIPDEHNVAYPNSKGVEWIPNAYTEYYQARFVQESSSDYAITQISPQDLRRFFQVYLITTDTQYRQPVTRKISVDVKIVQLSTIFLVIYLLMSIFCLLGVAVYSIFVSRRRKLVDSTPQSKLDWMLQSVERCDIEPASGCENFRRSVAVHNEHGIWMLPESQRKKAEFENAWYGQKSTALPLTSSYSPSPIVFGVPKQGTLEEASTGGSQSSRKARNLSLIAIDGNSSNEG